MQSAKSILGGIVLDYLGTQFKRRALDPESSDTGCLCRRRTCLAGSTIAKRCRGKKAEAVPYIVSWTRPKLLLRDLIRRGEREGRKIEASREKVQLKIEKKNHAREAQSRRDPTSPRLCRTGSEK